MALILTQTDTSIAFELGCSAVGAGVTTAGRQLVEGGTAGTTPFSIDPGNLATATVLSLRTTTGINASTWAAGDYVVRLNTTKVQGTNNWVATYICERTAGGAYNTVASLTGQALSVTNVGVVTMTVNRATDFTPVGTDSDLAILIVLENSDSHGASSCEFTPNQNVDTPIITVTSVDSIVPAGAGSLSVSGQAPTLVSGHVFVPISSSLSVAGQAATFSNLSSSGSDNFERPDELLDASPNWQTPTWSFSPVIINGVAQTDADNTCYAMWVGSGTYGRKQRASGVITWSSSVADYAGVAVYMSSANGCYRVWVRVDNGSATLSKVDNTGASTTLTTFGSAETGGVVVGDKLELEVDDDGSGNSLLTIMKNGSTIGTHTDSTSPLTSGQPGVGFSTFQRGVGLESWEAYDFDTAVNSVVTAGSGSLSVVGQAPTPITGFVGTSGSGSLSVLGEAPTVNTGSSVDLIEVVGTSSITISGQQASAVTTTSIDSIVEALAGSLTVTGEQPTANTGTSIDSVQTAGVGSLSVSGQAPQTVTGLVEVPGFGSLTIQGQQPTVATSASVDSVVESGVGSLSITGQSPSTATGLSEVVGTGSVSVQGQQPSVVTGSSVDLIETAGFASLSVTGQQPTVATSESVSSVVTVGTSSLSVSGESVETTVGNNVEAGAGELVVSGQQAIAQTGSSVSLSIVAGSGSLTVSGEQVTSEGGVGTVAGEDTLQVTGNAPTVVTTVGVLAQAGIGSVSISGQAPTVIHTASITVTAGTGSLTLTGQEIIFVSVSRDTPARRRVSLSGDGRVLRFSGNNRTTSVPISGDRTLKILKE